MTEGHDLRVLVIDDADEMRTVIRRILAADGYRVDDVATVAEARALDPYAYRAIIIDVRIGLERGTDFVREVVAAVPDMAGRCLVITGGSLDAIPEGIAYLAKPFGPDQLLAAVRGLNRADEVGEVGWRASAGGPAQETVMGVGQGKALLALVRMVRMRERRDLAERIHEGPAQELYAAALELHLMYNQQKAERTDLLELAIRQVDQATLAVQSLMGNQEQGGLPRKGTRLAPAVRDQTAWLLVSPAAVDIHPPQPDLLAEQVSFIADVAELMLFLLIGDTPPPSAHLSVQVTNEAIQINVTVTTAGRHETAQRGHTDPAGIRARLWDLAAALAATVQVAWDPDRVRAQLALPPVSTQTL
jgi:DNA-binding response OmpR family regulator